MMLPEPLSLLLISEGGGTRNNIGARRRTGQMFENVWQCNKFLIIRPFFILMIPLSKDIGPGNRRM